MKDLKATWLLAALLLVYLLAGCVSANGGPPGDAANPAGATATPTQPLEAPALVSSLLQYPVTDAQGQTVAQVSGLMLDMLVGQIPFLGVDLQGEGRPVLVPWQALTLQIVPPDESALADAQPAALQLKSPNSSLTGAPIMNQARYRHNQPLSKGWDTESRNYWSSQIDEIPLTSGSEGNSAVADQSHPMWLSSGQLQDIDYDILDAEEQALAEVKDFVVSTDGKVSFAVVAPGSQLDLNGQMTLVPWNGLRWVPEQSVFLLNLPLEAVAGSPRLDPQNLPDFTLPGWDLEWRDYWNRYQSTLAESTAQSVTPGAGVTQLLGSDLTGTQVVDQNGMALGLIEDWSIDPNGISRYVVIAASGQLIPVTWQGLSWQEDQTLLLATDPAVLQDAPSYRSFDELTGDQRWIENSDRFWNEYLLVSNQADQLIEDNAQPVGFAQALLDTVILDVQQNEVGQVADFLLDSSGNVLYVIAHRQDRYYPLPWMVFEYNFEENRLLYLDDSERLPDAPGFNAVADMAGANAQWDAEVRQFWGLK